MIHLLKAPAASNSKMRTSINWSIVKRNGSIIAEVKPSFLYAILPQSKVQHKRMQLQRPSPSNREQNCVLMEITVLMGFLACVQRWLGEETMPNRSKNF